MDADTRLIKLTQLKIHVCQLIGECHKAGLFTPEEIDDQLNALVELKDRIEMLIVSLEGNNEDVNDDDWDDETDVLPDDDDIN